MLLTLWIHAYKPLAEAVILRLYGCQGGGRIPGWSEYVQPVHEKSLFWHYLWLECGRPRTGVVANWMRRTRYAYHYATLKVKQNEDTIINEGTAGTMLNSNTREFWSEIK